MYNKDNQQQQLSSKNNSSSNSISTIGDWWFDVAVKSFVISWFGAWAAILQQKDKQSNQKN